MQAKLQTLRRKTHSPNTTRRFKTLARIHVKTHHAMHFMRNARDASCSDTTLPFDACKRFCLTRIKSHFAHRCARKKMRQRESVDASSCVRFIPERDYAESALMREERRDSLRDTVSFLMTPLVTARCSSGCALLNASLAALLLPEAIASSTLRRKVLTRERRALFTSVRRAILRTIFWADEVLAISSRKFSYFLRPGRGRGVAYSGEIWGRQRRIIAVFCHRWQAGHRNVDRPDWTIRRTLVPQAGQGLPSRS